MICSHNRVLSYCIILLTLFLPEPTSILARNGDLSPLDFGLLQAENGMERYNCLYLTHCAALEAGVNVTYKGIDSLDIEIAKDAKSIPLTDNTDFCGLVLRVRNNAKGHCIFELSQKTKELHVEKQKIDSGIFSDVTDVASGKFVLVLEDKTPWVKNRRGYQYGAIRKDIIVLNNGIAKNRPTASYNNDISIPKVTYFKASRQQKKITNLTFVRDSGNTEKAYLLQLSNQCGVEISNIQCETPKSDLFYDRMISLTDCSNIIFRNITISGTYSQIKKSGYGISMNNVYNVAFYNLNAHANWGIFGNNNVNNVRLYHCDINRFDIHCYGRDIFFENCKFRNLYNQFSSILGTVLFERCEFFNFTPVLLEPSYNAYTAFDLKFKNCVIHACEGKDFLISGGELKGKKTDERAELRFQSYPNLYIDGLKIDMPESIADYYIYRFRTNILNAPTVEGIREIKKVEFIKKAGNKLKEVDLRNQPIVFLELGGLSLLGAGIIFYACRNCIKSRINRTQYL